MERKSEFTGNVIKYPVTFFTSDDFDHRAFKAFVGMIFEESRQYSLQTRVKLAPLWDENGKVSACMYSFGKLAPYDI